MRRPDRNGEDIMTIYKITRKERTDGRRENHHLILAA